MAFKQLYSQKVLQHVKKPQNLGEIKNPDGMATVGNPVCGDVMRLFIKVEKKKGQEFIKDIKFQTLGCLPGEEEIVLSNGDWGKIKDILLHSKVINGNGKETITVESYKRKYKGTILKIIPFVSPFNSFSLTPNHPVLSIKRKWLKKTRKSSSKCGLLRVDKKELSALKPDYIMANELDKGDYLIFSFSRTIKDKRFFNQKMMRLLGYYLSEGYITGGNVINFSFNRKEKKLIEEVKFLVFEITHKKTSERTRKNVTEIRFCSKKWADMFYSTAGRLAKNKNLSPSVLSLPFKKQWEMVKTYMLGDGDIYRRRPTDSETCRITTVSKSLAVQIQKILARGGIFASLRQILKKNCQIDGRKLKDSIQYLISFKLERKHKFVHKYLDYFLVPIRKIEKKYFNDFVYNFQVAEEPNSYLARGFIVHNCGAAIATSSMITTMVKGKPLNQAEKITNQAIAEALGGLPPVKMHCSVLAAEALQKAIADYRGKIKK
jgi:NifU-like protein involved in Fe-S cluster formation